MDLGRLQEILERIYDVEVGHDVRRFVITDRRLARLLAGDRVPDRPERLLVHSGEGEVALSLYIDAAVMERLERDDPLMHLHEGNLADFCTVLEGVSHFVYLGFHARHDRPVTQLELEMQAEVDKYVTAASLIARQRGLRPGRGLRRRLFRAVRFAEGLAPEELRRYWWANRYAELYCARLEEEWSGGRRERPVVNELRRFYRLPQAAKIARVEALGGRP